MPAGAVIAFTKNGLLEVMGNGKLDLSGTLTSCNLYWQGVRLRGDVSQYPVDLDDQSSFIGRNHSKIENAIVGLGAWTEGVGFNTTKGTGKIDCNGTTFLDNAVSVKIKSYHVGMYSPFPPSLQIAKFINCNFEKNANSFFFENVNFVELESVVADGYPKAVYFNKCRFYQDELNPSSSLRGILSVGSRLYVERCSFSTLPKGLEVVPVPAEYFPDLDIWSLSSSKPYTVTKSRFSQCAIGIHNSGNTGANIKYNYFWLGKIPTAFSGIFESSFVGSNQQVGVYFEGNSNGFTFHHNTFRRVINTNDVNATSFGSYFRDLGASSSNMVAENRYILLKFGNFAERYNGHGHAGLTFVCNFNRNSSNTKGVDFLTYDNSPSSGHLAMRKDQGLAVGFDAFAPSLNRFSLSSIDFLAWGASDYKYYIPKKYVSGTWYIPKVYYGIKLKESVEKNYLCGTEFKHFADDAKLTEVEKMENRNNYFTNRQAFQQAKSEYASNGSASDKEAARKAMTYYRQEMDVAAYLGFINVTQDTTTRDTLRVWMDRFDNPAGDYMLVEDYIRTNEFAAATSLLESMPQKYDFTSSELDDHTNVTEIYDELMASSGQNLSEGAMLKLEEFADLPDGQSRYLARNILTTKGYFFMPSIAKVDLPEGVSTSSEDESTTKMSVSPNPVDYNATFDWSDFDVVGKDVTIEITNQEGGLVEILHPEATNYSLEWTTELVSDGICYYRLLIDDVEVDTGYIIINK